MVVTPEGTRILNLSEGMNDKMPSAEIADLKVRHNPDVVIGGYQLQFEREVARLLQGKRSAHGHFVSPARKVVRADEVVLHAG